MPMVAPSRSPTGTRLRSAQPPLRTREVSRPRRLTRWSAMARTPSATARVPLPGVTTTATPRALAASRSTRSTPTPVRATTRSRGARSRKAASTTASARAMAPTATARSSAPGSGTNDTPSPSTPATRAGSTWPRATTMGRSGIGSLPWWLGRAGADDQAGWDQLGPGLGAGLADAVQEPLGGGGPDLGVVGVDRGQRDLGDGGEEGVVVAGHRQLGRDGDAGLERAGQRAHGGQVVDHGDGGRPAAVIEQPDRPGVAGLLGEVAGLDPAPVGEAVAGHGGPVAGGARVGDLAPVAAEMGDPPVAPGDQVVDHQPGPGRVVAADHVGPGQALAAGAGDHHRDLPDGGGQAAVVGQRPDHHQPFNLEGPQRLDRPDVQARLLA